MSRSLGMVLGWVLDQTFGDPRRWHPVAGFGSAATALEQRTYAVRRARGVVHVALLVGAATGLGVMAERSTRRSDVAHTLVTAAATWAVLGGRSLTREATTIDGQLGRGDLEAARGQVRNLVGRDTTRLDGDEVARACIESLAENTSDAVVAPLLWGGLLGVPGLLGYRAVNTLDAMVGHRNDRYREFGWAAARLDDVVNWVPARVAAALALASAESRERAAAGWAAIRRDAPAHPSPNGGVVEAAFAGVLGVRLGGSNSYGGEIEDRGTLGDGPAARAPDIAPAARLARRVSAGSLAVAVAITAATTTRHLVRRRGA
ncbi:cobalamin biosynthesis protein [Terracoccus sp. 273MFTsu3.1]|uniref:cobalamin biosynthesis protein n=1 Tax=Terracoccus sp. 273MFTsu3.1 TaxID=1172188 RepID=UPI000490198B|nr:cobalamin biosynthesis protein [Terracoccus sp. 273MFTsu3.1]